MVTAHLALLTTIPPYQGCPPTYEDPTGDEPALMLFSARRSSSSGGGGLEKNRRPCVPLGKESDAVGRPSRLSLAGPGRGETPHVCDSKSGVEITASRQVSHGIRTVEDGIHSQHRS